MHEPEDLADLVELSAQMDAAGDLRGGSSGPPSPPHPATGSPARESEAPADVSDFPGEIDPVDVGSLLPPAHAEEGAPRIGPARISPELEQLLAAAEERVAGGARPSSVPSVDDDVDLLLGADVLAALDEPLDPEDEGPRTGSGVHLGTPQHGPAPQHAPIDLPGPSSLPSSMTAQSGAGAWAEGSPFGGAGLVKTPISRREPLEPLEAPRGIPVPPPISEQGPAVTPRAGAEPPPRASLRRAPEEPADTLERSRESTVDEERWAAGTRNEADARRAEIEDEDRARSLAAPLVSPPREVRVRSLSDAPFDDDDDDEPLRDDDGDEPRRSATISDLPLPDARGLRGAEPRYAPEPPPRPPTERPSWEPPGVIPLPRRAAPRPPTEPPGVIPLDRPLAPRPISDVPLPAPPAAPAMQPWAAPVPRAAEIHAAPEPFQRGGGTEAPVTSAAAPAVTVLGPGDAPRALARAVGSRSSGSMAITTDAGTRRVVLHEGDLVTAASDVPGETLLGFLAARGDLDRDLAARLAGRLPPSGRHAGAALIAHGYLGQDDLWPVLRAHAEWLIGHIVQIDGGTCEIEEEAPGRLKAEPNVFGGATGAEVFVETVRRVIPSEIALRRLGGPAARLDEGVRKNLLGECALRREEEEWVRAARGRAVAELVNAGEPEIASLLYALVCLEVLDVLIPPSVSEAPRPPEHDPLDEEAIRQRVRARLQLVQDGDYFAILGIPRDATGYEIKRAYLGLRRAFEPSRLLTAGTADLLDDVQLVIEVLDEAYDILRDNHRRERYRRAIEAPPP